jgi:hypothetical protein
MPQIKIVTPLSYKSWDDSILQLDGYSIFHSSHWAKLLHDSYGYEPHYFIIEEQGVLKSVFSTMVINSWLTGKRISSLPYTDFCKPLISADIDLNSFLKVIIAFGKNRNLKYVEFKDDEDRLSDFKSSVFQYRHKLKLDKSEDEIFSSFRKGTKSSIKKAIKEGVQVQINNSLESVERFCKMNHVTRKKHGLPPQPTSFFNSLYKYIISKNLGFVALATKQDQVVAGSVYLTFGEKVLYKYSASYPKFMHLMSNNVVMWESIKHSLNNKFEEIDFGISESANEGLRIYKNGWGVEESKVLLYKYDLKKDQYVEVNTKVAGFHNKIFSKAPVPLLKAFSTIFYKHFG